MKAAVEEVEAKLKLWSIKIDDLAARAQVPGAHVGFDALMYIDELKALHAVAKSKFDEFRVTGDAGRARLKAEMESACTELDAAFKTRSRRRR